MLLKSAVCGEPLGGKETDDKESSMGMWSLVEMGSNEFRQTI